MDPIELSRDGAHLAIGAFRACARQPARDIGDDAVEMLTDRSHRFGEAA